MSPAANAGSAQNLDGVNLGSLSKLIRSRTGELRTRIGPQPAARAGAVWHRVKLERMCL